MSERNWEPLAIAIMGLALSVCSYGVKDASWAYLAYGCGLISASFAVAHWFLRPQSAGEHR
jgi:hypothetical protein